MLLLKHNWACRLHFLKNITVRTIFPKGKGHWNRNFIHHETYECLTAVFVTPRRLSAAFFLAGSSHTFTQLSHLPRIFANFLLRYIFPAFRSAHRFSKGKEERSALGTLRVIAFEMIRHEHKWGWKSSMADRCHTERASYVDTHCPVLSMTSLYMTYMQVAQSGTDTKGKVLQFDF